MTHSETDTGEIVLKTIEAENRLAEQKMQLSEAARLYKSGEISYNEYSRQVDYIGTGYGDAHKAHEQNIKQLNELVDAERGVEQKPSDARKLGSYVTKLFRRD
jgi:hypothetical protein